MRTVEERFIGYDSDGNALSFVKICGKSTDTKPVGNFCTGSEFFEIDTGTTDYYDEDGASGSEWVTPTPADS